jgi:hypothetical protein
MSPSLMLVITATGSQTAMQIANKTITQSPQSLVMKITNSPMFIVETTTPRACPNRTKRPLINRISKTPVPHEPGNHNPSTTRLSRQRRSPSIVPACFGRPVSIRIITKLCQNPGTKNHTKPRHRTINSGIRVHLKICGEFNLEQSNLTIQFGEDRARRRRRRTERGINLWPGEQAVGNATPSGSLGPWNRGNDDDPLDATQP